MMDDAELTAAVASTTSAMDITTKIRGEAENIAVCIRVRPLNDREHRNQDVNVLRTIHPHNMISIIDSDGQPLGGKHNVFQYDHIYDQSHSTRHMYDHVAKRIVKSTLEGINGTIFAYGQTSSGKTYTMQGNNNNITPFDSETTDGAVHNSGETGILQLAVEDIFNYIENCSDRDFLLRVSFVEIYNEVVKDLLSTHDKGLNLKLREDPRKGVYVECKEEIITTYEDILNLLQIGNQRRTVGQTAMNERSSRSHSIFRIVIESKEKCNSRRQSEEDMNGAVLVACLSLVDLAGSESMRHTAAEGIRQREAGNINKSLLTLSRVINSLASNANGGQNAPFRDSKLTRLLQNSLDGNTRTLIICCVTPSDRYLEETRSTLQFAARAKNIQTAATVNEVLDDQAQLKRLKREVHELKKLVNSEAYNALKAENEALLNEKNHHKAEMVRLMGLMLSSGTARTTTERSRNGGKRNRETWCPGDFAASNIKPLRSLENQALLSPNPQPRKRPIESGSKENIHPQNLLQSLDNADGDEDENPCDTASPSKRRKRDSNVAELNQKLLHIVETALRSYRDDGIDPEQLESMIQNFNEDRERLNEVLKEIKRLAETSVHSEAVTGANEILKMEVEELRTKLTLQKESPAENNALNSATMMEELKSELAEIQESMIELCKEKEQAERVAAEENSKLTEQVQSLRIEMDKTRELFETEKNRLETALHESTEELAALRLRTNNSRTSDADESLDQSMAQLQLQFEEAKQEILRLREEQEESKKLHEEMLMELEMSTKSTIDELSQKLEDAFVEVEEVKLLKTEEIAKFQDELAQKVTELNEQRSLANEREKKLLEELAQRQQSTSFPADDEEKSRLRSETETLQNSLQEMEEIRNALELQTIQLNEELRAIKARQHDDVDPASNFSNQPGEETDLQSLKVQNEQLNSERTSLMEAMVGLEEQLQQTAKYHADLEAQVKYLVEEKTTLMANRAEMEAQIDDLAQLKEKLSTENNDLRIKCLNHIPKSDQDDEKMAEELQSMLQELTRLQAQFEQQAVDKQELEVNYSEMSQRLDALNKENAELRKKNQEELAMALKERDDVAVSLQNQLEAKEMARAQLQIKYDEDIFRLQHEVENMSTMHEQEKQKSVTCIQTLEDEKQRNMENEHENNMDFTNEIQSRELELVALKAEQAELLKKLQALSEEKEAWTSSSHLGANQEAELLARIEILSNELAASQSKLEALEAEKEHLIEATKVLNEEKQQVQSDYTKLVDEKVRMEGLLSELESEKQALSAKITELRMQFNDKKNAESSSSQDHEQIEHVETHLPTTLTALEEENKELTEELEKVRKERNGFVEELSTLEVQLMEASQEIMKLTVASEELEQKLQYERSLSNSTNDNISSLKAALAQEQADKEALADQLSKIEITKINLDATVEQQGGAVAPLKAEKNSSLKKIDQVETSHFDSSVKTVDLGELQQRLDIELQLRETLELDVKSYEETLSVLRIELKSSSDTITELLEKLKSMEQELEANARDKTATEKEIDILKDTIQRSKEEVEELRLQSQQRLRTSEQKEMMLQETISTLEQQLADSQATLTKQQVETLTHNQQRDSVSEQEMALQQTIQALSLQLSDAKLALSAQNAEWKSKQNMAEKQFSQMTCELNHLKESNLILQEKSIAMEAEHGKLLSELLKVKRAYTEILEEKDELVQELAATNATWQAKEAELSKKVSLEMDTLREQYQAAQEELEAYQKYADEEIHKLRESIEMNDVEMAELSRAAEVKEEAFANQLKERDELVAQFKAKHEELLAECTELYNERQTLTEKRDKLEAADEEREGLVEQLRNQLRELSFQLEQAEAKQIESVDQLKDMKSAMEKIEGEAYQHRNELEEMSESLKSAQLEAMHYHNQLVEAQLSKEEMEKVVETQKKRIDKLEKVKMTTETLDLFRKLKSDRQELQIKVQQLQQELCDAEASAAQSKEISTLQNARLLERKEEEIKMFKDHIQELSQALRSEKEKCSKVTSELKAAVHDEMEKSRQEISDMQMLLKEKSAQVEILEEQIVTIEKEKLKIQEQQSDNVTYLEKENLELLVENRKLKKRLEGMSLSASHMDADMNDEAPYYDEPAVVTSAALADMSRHSTSSGATTSKSASPSSSLNNQKNSATHGFLVPTTETTKDESEEQARPACTQQ